MVGCGIGDNNYTFTQFQIFWYIIFGLAAISQCSTSVYVNRRVECRSLIAHTQTGRAVGGGGSLLFNRTILNLTFSRVWMKLEQLIYKYIADRIPPLANSMLRSTNILDTTKNFSGGVKATQVSWVPYPVGWVRRKLYTTKNTSFP